MARGFVALALVFAPYTAQAAAVTGTITLSKIPAPSLASVLRDRHVCGQEGEISEGLLSVDASGRCSGVVVAVDPLAPMPTPPRRGRPPPVVIDQRNCVFSPAVTATEVGAELRFRNSDPVLHNVHATQGGKTIANFAMPVRGQEVSAGILTATGDVELRCDAGHRWMRSVIRVLDHPRFAVTDAAGRFRIAGLRPGRYKVAAWHPDLGERSAELEIRWAGEEHVISLGF